ncbi:MAG: hypothetical protein U0441_04060 [Polyangiaceae bacterium]
MPLHDQQTRQKRALRRFLPALLGASAIAIGTVALPGIAAAQTALRADLIEAKTIKLDGVPKEWTGLSSLGVAVKGKPAKPDLEAKAGIVYDATNLYVAADVTDDTFKPGLDHLVMVLGFPGGTTYEVEIAPGDPGKTPGSAKLGGKAITGAKVVEAPSKTGWSVEAQIPWSAFAMASSVRVGLRGALFVHDADGASVDLVAGTASSTAYASLPQLATESEQALADGLIKEKGLKGAPKYNLLGDVAGDSMKERVLVYERYLVVLGSGFRKGSEYYYSDLGVDSGAGMVPACELRDVTGDGQQEILIRKRFGSSTKYRETYQVLWFGKNDVPNPILTHEVAIVTADGTLENAVTLTADGSKTAFKFEPGTVTKWNAGNYKEATEGSFDPALLPWGTIKSQTYKYDGSKFTKSAEEKQEATPAPASTTPVATAVATPKVPAPSAAELLDQVYAMYKKDRGASGKPRFDMAIDVVGDKQTERILVHEKDIVLFGKGFKSGTGYSYLTLQQFASASDITELTARDVTGDGKAEIIVKGVLHANAPKEAGGGTVDREVVLIFQVQGESLKRIFAAELGRGIGSNKVTGNITFSAGGKATELELGPGKFVGWTDKTYPFNQDISPVGGYEPLILPISSNKPVRYKWGGSAFSK